MQKTDMEFEGNLETDGVKEKDLGEECDKVNVTESGKTLEKGFGFTKETEKFRISVNDNRGAENPRAKTPHSDEVVDIDTIIVTGRETVLKQPLNIPDGFVHTPPGRLPPEPKVTCLCLPLLGLEKPDDQSVIVIPHKKADKPDGDYFGASLCTFKTRRKDREGVYYRHFLVEVDSSGPAEQMRIESYDELVLLNEVFAPELTHEETLDLFRAVKVDGKTRLYLVIRRALNKKKWEWIETSAVLSPDRAIDQPHIEDLEYTPLDSEQIEVSKSKHLYKATGTEKFLDICDGKLTIGTLNGDTTDRTKTIWKREKYWEDDDDTGYIDFAAALCDETETWYIAVDQRNNIVLRDSPLWFKFIKVGGKVRFQFKDIYLGYDRDTGEVKAEVSACVFEEYSVTVNKASNPTDQNSDLVTNNIEVIPATSSNDRSRRSNTASSVHDYFDRRSFSSSQRSVDSEKSFASSQRSVDSERSVASLQRSVDSERSFSSSQRSIDSDRRSIASSQRSIDSDRRSITSSQTSVDSDRYSIISSQVSFDGSSHGYSTNGTSALSLSQSSGTSGYISETHTEELDNSPTKDNGEVAVDVENNKDSCNT